MTEDRKPSRLPPPAFPPGNRRPDEALHDPDGPPADDEGFTFISPDDPFPQEGFEEGTVTGIGDDAHLAPEELVAGGDPFVTELTQAVTKLAEGLRRRGEAGLHATPEMTRFEATLRAYCVGYLAGRRGEVDRQ